MKINKFFYLLFFYINFSFALPQGFVYLSDINPSIVQEIRYAGSHNFVGRPIKGYYSNKCILTREAAKALSRAQKELLQSGYSIKIYDCFRPTIAVNDFITWSNDIHNQQMKSEFYPNVNKADFFRLGYIAKNSGHSRGSTVDLTIISVASAKKDNSIPEKYLIACTAPYSFRYQDGSIDMGTNFDCMDELSSSLNSNVNPDALQNRMFLRNIMIRHGFQPYDKEWWHFTYKREPFPKLYFNFYVK